LFVIATVLAAEVVPEATVPKARLAGAMVNGRAPVPVRATTCGESGALSLMESVPVIAPPTDGVKVTVALQLAPAVKLAPQLVVGTPKFPVAVSELILTVEALVFLKVTSLVALVLPTSCGRNTPLADAVDAVTGVPPL